MLTNSLTIEEHFAIEDVHNGTEVERADPSPDDVRKLREMFAGHHVSQARTSGASCSIGRRHYQLQICCSRAPVSPIGAASSLEVFSTPFRRVGMPTFCATSSMTGVTRGAWPYSGSAAPHSHHMPDCSLSSAASPRDAQLPLSVLHADLEMLVMCGGQERTQRQYADLLTESGFRLTDAIATGEDPPHTIYEAVPA